MPKKNRIQRGTQIAYIPNHAEGDINHPDVEFGFVTNVVQTGYRDDQVEYFCRFWFKGKPGEMRTTLNSEKCYPETIVAHNSVDQSVVDRWLGTRR